MGYAVYYQDEGRWTWSRHTAVGQSANSRQYWAAFTAAEWVSQQKLDWSYDLHLVGDVAQQNTPRH
jgi:hypothetical protein